MMSFSGEKKKRNKRKTNSSWVKEGELFSDAPFLSNEYFWAEEGLIEKGEKF